MSETSVKNPKVITEHEKETAEANFGPDFLKRLGQAEVKLAKEIGKEALFLRQENRELILEVETLKGEIKALKTLLGFYLKS